MPWVAIENGSYVPQKSAGCNACREEQQDGHFACSPWGAGVDDVVWVDAEEYEKLLSKLED